VAGTRIAKEAAMGSFKHPRVFHPLDLEILDYVYEAAWAELEARNPFRDRDKDGEREEVLRKLVMDQAGTSKVDFDTLLGRVVTNMPETWVVFARTAARESTKVGA
jgi:hypothetical protein